MICKKCGCRVSDTASFCDKCGASMAEFGQKEAPKPATDEKFSTMFGKVKDNKQAKIILLVAVAIIVILCAILFTNKSKAAKPFRLESGMTDKEVVEILGPRDDYDTFDTIKWGKQYLYCWYDIPLGKYSGTLQANFKEKDGKIQLGYLRWIADNASSKELKQYAEKTYGKSDTIADDSILYEKEVGNWTVHVSEEGTITWQDIDILKIVVDRSW